MKEMKIIAVFCLLLLPLALSAQVDRRIAQPRNTGPRKEPEKIDHVAKSVAVMKKELSLDNFQEAVVKNLIEDYQKAQMKILEAEAPDESKMEQLTALQEKFASNVKKILRPEQLVAYDEMLAKSQKKKKKK